MNVSTFLSQDIKTKTFRVINDEKQVVTVKEHVSHIYKVNKNAYPINTILDIIFYNDTEEEVQFNIVGNDNWVYNVVTLYPQESYERRFWL